MGYRGWGVHCLTEEAVLPCLFIQVPGEEGRGLIVSVIKDTSSPVNGGKIIYSVPWGLVTFQELAQEIGPVGEAATANPIPPHHSVHSEAEAGREEIAGHCG